MITMFGDEIECIKRIELIPRRIKSFDEMLKIPTDELFYIGEDLELGVVIPQTIEKKKTWLHSHVYFQLHDQLIEPTKVTRDNFHTCGYSFYTFKTKKKWRC